VASFCHVVLFLALWALLGAVPDSNGDDDVHDNDDARDDDNSHSGLIWAQFRPSMVTMTSKTSTTTTTTSATCL